MSDTNKIIAAILTAGRMPTLGEGYDAPSRKEWLAEYEAWLKLLVDGDQNREASRDA